MKRIDKVRIIPLGGLNEIGKNLTLIECGKDIIAIDCGIAFPDEDLPGVDYVIPDMQYIVKNADRFRAVFSDPRTRGSHRRDPLLAQTGQCSDIRNKAHSRDR